VWAAAVLALSGYIGSVIALNVSSPTSSSPEGSLSYLAFVVVMMAVLAGYFLVLPISLVMGVELLRAGKSARAAALRRSCSPRVVNDEWVDHLSRPTYSWAALVAFFFGVPLATAVLFWSIAATGLSV
jgi:hypothetical protein